MRIQTWPFLLLFVILFAGVGCIVGVRGHQFAGTVTDHGQTADVTGSAHAMELGIVADFRYFRLALPFEGLEATLTGSGRDGGRFVTEGYQEFRALRLDVPLLSFYEFSKKSWLGYPGRMVHRQSIELWWTGAMEPTSNPYWWTDVGVTYYHHNLVAVRIFGGYAELPFNEAMRGVFVDGQQTTRNWEGRAPGISFGLDITLFAGEHALDFLMYMLDEDRRQRKNNNW
ncbi:MAG: hypothetical protein ACNA8W_26170 [Bradymonadaceae bacterium]